MGKVLVVDDSRAIRETMAMWLRSEGFVVLEAEDGMDALEILKGNAVELAIVDLNMPRLDGLGFVAALRATGETVATKVVILTTETSSERVTKGRSLGVLGWMVKPVERPLLVAAVKKVLAPKV